jgi:hypothetical protein
MDVSEAPAGGQVRNSNAYSLRARLSEFGAMTRSCGAVTDNLNESKAALEEALRGPDLLITTGFGRVIKNAREYFRSFKDAGVPMWVVVHHHQFFDSARRYC